MTDSKKNPCFYDEEGTPVYPTEWRSSGIGCWFSGPAKARRNGKWSFLDVNGAYITEDLFDDVGYFHGGIARVKKDGLWGFIDISGNYISLCQWTYARNLDMEEKVAQVSDGKNWGFIDITGKLVCPCVWEWMHEDFDCGMVMVMDGATGLFGFLTPEGKQIGGWLTHIGPYRGGLARACQNEKWGFVRDSGSLAIPCQWDDVRDFSEGFACVKKDGKWGILDINGTLVVPCRWEDICSFRKGILTVMENGEEFRVDISGNRI